MSCMFLRQSIDTLHGSLLTRASMNAFDLILHFYIFT
jgi:hypothetical protein